MCTGTILTNLTFRMSVPSADVCYFNNCEILDKSFLIVVVVLTAVVDILHLTFKHF